jgi:hypothetical protein
VSTLFEMIFARPLPVAGMAPTVEPPDWQGKPYSHAESTAFGLDSALRQDPRYYRSLSTGFWRRAANDGETLSTWRIGSAYGTAILPDTCYPDRLNTARLGAAQGSVRLAFDLAGNPGQGIRPDIKRELFRRKETP